MLLLIGLTFSGLRARLGRPRIQGFALPGTVVGVVRTATGVGLQSRLDAVLHPGVTLLLAGLVVACAAREPSLRHPCGMAVSCRIYVISAVGGGNRLLSRSLAARRDVVMHLKYVLWVCLGLAVIGLVAFAAWILMLPPGTAAATGPAVPSHEVAATLAGLKPPKRQRPLIAVVGINDATETTDYLVPAGILRRADVADVVMLATEAGPLRLYPALTVEPEATIAQFDAQQPEGADYVIVPAMSRDKDTAALRWIRSQASKGATIIGVCAGAKVVAAAGLLEGKRATTHWYYLADLLGISPTTTYIANRRFVIDGRVATTTGITASMPMMLTLIEAIAGRDRAASVAGALGVGEWDARHVSSAFGLTRPFALTVLANRVRFWKREQLGLELSAGMDEVSLALLADAWSRTYRSHAVTFARASGAVETRNGLRIIPDQSAASRSGPLLPGGADGKPATVLDDALRAITRRYGSRTAAVVAMQLEYPWRRVAW